MNTRERLQAANRLLDIATHFQRTLEQTIEQAERDGLPDGASTIGKHLALIHYDARYLLHHVGNWRDAEKARLT